MTCHHPAATAHSQSRFSPLCLAFALHLLLLIAGVYGLRSGRTPGIEQEVYPVTILSLADLTGQMSMTGETGAGSSIQAPAPAASSRVAPAPALGTLPESGRIKEREVPPFQPVFLAPSADHLASDGAGNRQENEGISAGAQPAAVQDTDGDSKLAALATGGADGPDPGPDISKRQYLERLASHIESCKFYPPAARRRHIAGEVEVRFILDSAGDITKLQARGGSPMLEQAAMAAVKKALPLPPPGGRMETPFAVTYRMEFRLR